MTATRSTLPTARRSPGRAPRGKLGVVPNRVRPGALNAQRLVTAANRWRDQYNPLRGLTLERAVSLLESGDRGEFADLQWTYRFIERRNATCRALIQRRRAALQKLDWEILTPDELPPGASEAQAEAQKEYLRGVYDGIENLRQAIAHLALAEFRGYSHLQIQQLPDGGRYLEPLHQWNWIREGLDGDWYWNPEARSVGHQSLTDWRLPLDRGTSGPKLNRDDFLIRTVDMPIDELALIIFLRKSLGQKDWDAFVEIYGIPGVYITLPPNIPADKLDEYQTAAEAAAQGGSGALPHGSDMKAPPTERGTNPFEAHLKYQDQELVLAGTGGKLTMLTESGSGTLAGGAHQDAFDEIAEAEAAEISETFQRDLDRVLLAAQFPGQPVLAYFNLQAQAKEDVKSVVEQVAILKSAGYTVDSDQIEERTGFHLEDSEPAAAAGQGTPSAASTASTGSTASTDPEDDPEDSQDPAAPPIPNRDPVTGPAVPVPVAKALATDLAPIRQRLERILAIEDPEIQRERLAAFQAELPQLFKDIAADPAAASALAAQLAARLIDGLATKP